MNKSKPPFNKSYTEYIRTLGEQYEGNPYPERDPENEKRRLLPTMGDMLCHINHYCFNGSRDFTSNFRVLVAGGGTGDALIFLADSLG
jgi:hypothetical protein